MNFGISLVALVVVEIAFANVEQFHGRWQGEAIRVGQSSETCPFTITIAYDGDHRSLQIFHKLGCSYPEIWTETAHISDQSLYYRFWDEDLSLMRQVSIGYWSKSSIHINWRHYSEANYTLSEHRLDYRKSLLDGSFFITGSLFRTD